MDRNTGKLELAYSAMLADWGTCAMDTNRGGAGVLEVDDAFDSMCREWSIIASRAMSEGVNGWEEQLSLMQQEQAALKESGEWFAGRTDMLSVLGRGRREVDHCAILAWLLDPEMPHGLGVRFLQHFLAACAPGADIARSDLRAASARCEECRDRSRADLVLRLPRHMLVMEAKIDHIERPNQCDDIYLDYRNEQGAIFVFLTPNGRVPETATGPAAGAFVPMSFPQVRSSLCAAIAEAGDALARHAAFGTIMTYLQTLEGEFE